MVDATNIPGSSEPTSTLLGSSILAGAASAVGLGSLNTTSPEAFYNSMQAVIGRPHTYTPSADPGTRVFARHMMQAPPLVMIRPGRVQFTETKDLIAVLSKSLGMDSNDVTNFFKVGNRADGSIFDMQTKYGVGTNEVAAMNKALSEKQLGTVTDFSSNSGASPIRYFEFKPALDEYMSVLATLSARIYSRLTSTGTSALPWANFGDTEPKGTTFGGFSTFWADNATSVSESASSEVGQTAVAGIVKGLAEKSREAQFVLGSDFLSKDTSANDGLIKTAADSIASTLGRGATANDPRTTGIAASLGDAILGINPMFPEVWKDSAFSRSYDLSFKFHSPYGTPGAVYQNVLLPFTQLLSLVLPVLRNPGTYSEPFVFQLDCPGHFACDVGICTDFSFTRGGSDHLWTAQGLPRQIDVTMRVKDLYPTLAASQNNRSLYCNIGMATFLDNMAAINLFASGQATNPIKLFQAQINTWLTQGYTKPDRIKAAIQNYFAQPGSIGNLFR